MPNVSIKVKVDNLPRTIGKEIEKDIDKSVPIVAKKLASDVRKGATDFPVDTGKARRGCHSDGEDVVNEVEYVEFVHKGDAVSDVIRYIEEM